MGEMLLPLLLSAEGLFFLILLRGGPLFAPRRAWRLLLAGEPQERKRARKNLTLALAGTLGVGNLTGVAVGMRLGGAGMLFWLVLSGVFTSVLKYAETVITASRVGRERGGMAKCLEESFPRAGRILAPAYAFLSLLLSLTMGSGFQLAAATDVLIFAFPIPKGWCAAMLTVVLVILFALGAKSETAVTEVSVPLGVALYLLLSLLALFRNAEHLPSVFARIVSEAFCPAGAAAGVSSFAFAEAVRRGFSVGLLSNEAGSGTSAMAHARSGISPAGKGVLSAFEVLFDTALCLLSGVILCLGDPELSAGGAGAVCLAFSRLLGRWSLFPLAFSVIAFALSTAVCSASYGRESLGYLLEKCKNRGPLRALYLPVFLICSFAGSFADRQRSVGAIDAILFLMCALTLPALIKNAGKCKHLSAKCGLLRKSFEETDARENLGADL